MAVNTLMMLMTALITNIPNKNNLTIRNRTEIKDIPPKIPIINNPTTNPTKE